MNDGNCVIFLLKLTTQNKHVYRTWTSSQFHRDKEADMARRQTKAMVVNGNTQTAVSCYGRFCTLVLL